MTASSAFLPFQGVSWCEGAPLKVYLTPSMFMQQVPNPGAGREVVELEWLLTITSMPLKTPASNMTALALGGIISSPGQPNTTTLPGDLVRLRYSAMATAAAMPTGPWALCWSPWNGRVV